MSATAVIAGLSALATAITGGVSAYQASKSKSSSSSSSTSGTQWYDYLGNTVSDLSDTYSSYAAEKKEEERYKKQMEREDNAYQRAVADMTAAGINPASAFGQSGAAASSSATFDPKAYLEASQINAGINLANAQAKEAEASANLHNEQADVVKPQAESQIELTEAEIKEVMSRTKLNDEQVKVLESQLPAVLAQAKLDEFDANQQLQILTILGISSKDRDAAYDMIKNGNYAGVVAVVLMNSAPEIVQTLSAYGQKFIDFCVSHLDELSHSSSVQTVVNFILDSPDVLSTFLENAGDNAKDFQHKLNSGELPADFYLYFR